VPLAFDASGTRLLAQYVGLDTSQAWTIDVPSGRARELRAGSEPASGAAISSDGATVLIDSGGFLEPPSFGKVESIPFEGGAAQMLVTHGSDPSWNR
jgi:hypothetical protein